MGCEDDLKDTDPVDENVPNTIRNISSESPRSSLTEASRLSAAELGCPRKLPNPEPKATSKCQRQWTYSKYGRRR